MKNKQRNKKEYLIVIEKSQNGFGVFSPDIPGCIALGDTRQEAKKLMKEAIKLHLRGLQEDGLKLPHPYSRAEYVKIAA